MINLARRIVQEVQYIHKKLEDRHKNSYDDWDEHSALHRWALVCGPSAMDGYLFSFVLDEMRLIHQKSSANAAALQKSLCHLMSFILRDGMPMERISPRPHFSEERRQARNAEEAFLAVLNASAQTNKIISNIEFLNNESFGNWILTLQTQRTSDENVLALECLSYLNLRGSILHIKDFLGSNLQKTDLSRASLSFINLYKANLEEVNLEGAHLLEANLQRTNLHKANLEGANLHKANLEGANLEGANLHKANLHKANLEGANLHKANLEGANLHKANLHKANLEGANIEFKPTRKFA
jgi:uncharacterized protein YjbI with pentapeptide repeats